MTDRPLKDEVLAELGDDRLNDIAGLLHADADAARHVVSGSVASLTGVLTDDSLTPGGTAELCQAIAQAAMEPEPRSGADAVGSGLVGAVLGKVAEPTARAVASKQGLPVEAVAGALEIILPVTATVLARRARA
jgi:hypothetical protein